MLIPRADRLAHVGEYFFSRKLREVARLRSEGRDIINLGIGSPDLPPSDETVKELNLAAFGSGSHGYQPYHGTSELRSAMADWYSKTYGVSLQAESQVLPLMGSKEGIFHTSMAFLNPGDQALIPDPGYPSYAAVTHLVGARPVPYDLTDGTGWLPDLQALAKQDLSLVRIMWLNYPHMPTGAQAHGDDFDRVIRFARDQNILIVHDNPYSLILNPEPPLSILSRAGAFDVCLELNSLSKAHHMAGWRVGMLSGHDEYIKAVLTVKSNMDSGMFLPVQRAASAALRNPGDWHVRQNEIYRTRRRLTYALMDALGCKYVKDRPGLFVWAKAPDHIEDIEMFLDKILYEASVFLTPGVIFGKNGERYVRASLCVDEERVAEATERIHSILGKAK